jgi:fibronectin type 3 domain-containing protein
MSATRLLPILPLLFIGQLASGQQRSIRILDIQPTVLFPRHDPLQQIAVAQLLNNSDSPVACTISTAIGGNSEIDTSVELPPGASSQRIPVSDIQSPMNLVVTAKCGSDGAILATASKPWSPQRKWKVYIVQSSHEDIGYEDFVYKKQHEIANYIDIAKRLSDPNQAMGHGDYHYTLETLLFMRNYIDERSEIQWRDLVEQHIKNGQLPLMGAPSGVHTHWMDYEELARMSYPARREVLDRFGLDLKTFMIVDNPSLSWSGAEALSDAGFRYVARWGATGTWRAAGNNDYEHTKVPAIFWWRAPDGVHKILFAWRSGYGMPFWYGQNAGGYGNLRELGSEQVSKELKKVEDGSLLGPYPYDAVIYPSYVDHAVPHVDEGALPGWNKTYAYPEIHIRSATDFFEYMEDKYGKDVPVLSGDLNNFYADYATIDPESQGWKRQASRALPVAEGLSAIDSYMDAAYQPVGDRAAKIWTQIFDYDEHSWPTEPRASDIAIFNAAWVKKNGAKRALRDTYKLLDTGMQSLASRIRSDGNRIVVFNSLAHERDDLVKYAGNCVSVEDLSTQKLAPCESDGSGQSIFIARGVPAFGYKVYRASGETASGSAGISTTMSGIENQFYVVRFDRQTGNVVSIMDKVTGRELVDPKARYQFNQMVYVHKNAAQSQDGFEYSPTHAKETKPRRGAISVSFDSWTDDAKTGAAIHQTVTLYDGLRRIDIVDDLQHARIMFSRNYEDRYKENIFYAFPLAVPNGQPRAEYPGGVVRPYLDQQRWGSHDFLSADRWVDVSNKDFGVTLGLVNSPIVEFGEIRYNQFSIDYKPTEPYLFGYAWSNRMAGLLTLNGDDCNATFRYSLSSHSGDWDSGATTRFGWSVASPLIAVNAGANPNGPLDSRQSGFFSVDAPDVEMTVLKQSEQPGKGWIVRLVETDGKPTTLAMKSNLLPLTAAYETDLTENDTRKLNVDNGTVKANILPFGYLTLRLTNNDVPARVENLSAAAQSGEKTLLQWHSTAPENRYEVFRSDDPRDPATEYTMIGTTTVPEFHDDGLDPGTTYFYRVAAVSKQNMGGPESAPASVTTHPAPSEPPSAVKDLSVIRLSTTRLMVTWRKSVEKDAARYYVYRGDHAGFDIRGMTPLAILEKSGYSLETFIDQGLVPGKQYFYEVFPENWAGLRQEKSTVAMAMTPSD